ncbi:DegV family protein [Bacteroides sedimenti]|uniref:DhaL domain-containing protein n=1 Tax=Bacteroides sedimenti TaxID=2136147 RepID=A0ABM8IA24_9BACE
MKNSLILEIDGRSLYYAFLAGGYRILENQAEINRINVFPVKDNDTGTNLASTVRSVIDSIKPDKSYKNTLDNIAEAALIGARGNSGVIFAQFLFGVSKETNHKNSITVPEFAASIKRSIPYMYDAIANPVEGTMLTVIKEWSDYIFSKQSVIQDFKKILVSSLEVLHQSLIETTSRLLILEKNKLVDAGAKGFVYFMEGIIDFIKNYNIRKIVPQLNKTITLIHSDDAENGDINYRYCTEALLRDISISKPNLQKLLIENGDSVVVAGSDSLCRIHVHTNHPADLFHTLKDFGTISYQKVDDMVRQNEYATHRKWNIALVTDSACDLSEELIDYYQINVVPLNINWKGNYYLDKVTMQPNQLYDLLDNSDELPKTSQINERTFINLYSKLASHYDAIIAVHLTQHFSGTYLNSVKAAERISGEFQKPVYVIDSKNLSGALGLLVLRVAQSIESGMPILDIVNAAEDWIKNARIFVSVKDLKYMIRGGRVSKKKGFLATLLGINPVVSMDNEGKAILFGKTFGQAANINKVMNHICTLTRQQQVWNYIVLHAHNKMGADVYTDKMIALTGKQPVSVVDISPVIGMNAGVGSIAVSLLLE